MESQAKFVSMRFKLTGLVGGFLLAMALILGLFFNMLLGSTTGSYAEKHVEDLARMMIVSLEAAPSEPAVQSIIDSFSDIPGALHATLRDSRGNLLSVWPKSGGHLESVVSTDDTSRTGDAISVTRTLKLADGRKAVVTVGLTTSGVAEETSNALIVFGFLAFFLVVIGRVLSSSS